MTGCTCSKVYVGGHDTFTRNWNPDCTEHGVESKWWKSDEQVAKREAQGKLLRELQLRAKELREKACGL